MTTGDSGTFSSVKNLSHNKVWQNTVLNDLKEVDDTCLKRIEGMAGEEKEEGEEKESSKRVGKQSRLYSG